jgi:predicted nucleic acid-binding Zn ribbon protein
MADEPTAAGTPTDREPDEPAEEHEAPTRICLKCATQSQTGGDFCPRCGARNGKRRRSKRALALMIGIPVVLVTVAGCGSGSTHPRGGVRDEPVHALRQLIADVASANARAVCSMMAPVLHGRALEERRAQASVHGAGIRRRRCSDTGRRSRDAPRATQRQVADRRITTLSRSPQPARSSYLPRHFPPRGAAANL